MDVALIVLLISLFAIKMQFTHFVKMLKKNVLS